MPDGTPQLDPFGGRDVPASLEGRVTNSLRTAGLIGQSSTPWVRRVALGAAAAGALALAFVGGRLSGAQRFESVPEPAFLLLLYEGPGYRDDRPVREIVREYAAWADSLRHAGVLVLGEKLAEAHLAIPTGTGSTSLPRDLPTGLFIVRASGLPQASALASTSPHLRYGGRILLSPIER